MSEITTKRQIYSIATDPIYIGTGGYTIGRVDNTIVRDPITKIPKIPGSSLAGTWRYYVALELQIHFKYEYKMDLSKRTEKKNNIEELFNEPKDWMKNFNGNRFARIKCAGQDDLSGKTIEEMENEKSGHCGHCIVCKAFGYSKKNQSWQGMLFFSDLNILFFPVYTRLGVKWISSSKILKETLNITVTVADKKIKTYSEVEKTLNLGWLNLEVEGKHELDNNKLPDKIKDLVKEEDIIIVPDSLISQIINSNLEVRTSVSINPITGAAKEGALFTSEAIPRGTIFYGEIRVFDKTGLDNILPSKECIFESLDDTKEYYETLGIGGMTTRGFGRMKILTQLKDDERKKNSKNSSETTEGVNNGQQS